MVSLLQRPYLNLFHVLFVSIPLMILGFAPDWVMQNASWLFTLTGVVGVGVLLFHSWRMYQYNTGQINQQLG